MAPAEDDKIIAQMIRRLRREREITQSSVAIHLGVVTNVVSRMEKGTRRINLPELRMICELFGVDLRDFLTEYLRRVQEMSGV